jgi:ATP-binding cassette subfamily B protein RaxB
MFARKTLPVYLQSEAAECGLAAVGMVAAYWGRQIDLPELRRRFPVTLQGATLNDLIRTAERLDFKTRALRVELEALGEVRLPAVLHWEFNHFVVLKRLGRNHAIIHDPGAGERRIPMAEFSRSFTGIVLELLPSSDFRPERTRTTIGLGRVVRGVNGLVWPLTQTLVLSLFIQAIAIGLPFLTQLAIDDVVPTGDLDLLMVLAIGFGVIYVAGPVLEWLRKRLVIFLSVQFSSQMTTNVVGYLLNLPLGFFEKRSIGDLLARLDASERLRELLTEGFVTAAVDVLLATITLGMMFYYSVTLGVIVTITTVAVIALRMAFIPELRRLVNETLQRKGLEQSELIESLRGIASVKLFQKEAEREAIWNNRFSGYLNTTAALQSQQANYMVIKDVVVNISIVVLIYMGIKFVLDGESAFTLGGFVAFAAYREMFFQRLNSFLNMLIQFSLSRTHLERLGEILSEEKEEMPSDFHLVSGDRFSLELNNVSYRFAEHAELVLRDVDMTISKGERIVLFGPSGSGKTTLLKMLAGVYEPSEGHLRLNGIDVVSAGLKVLRSRSATVMQGDYLFKGSVLDNITFFDRLPDTNLAMQCAKLACIDEAIERMPMSYETLIGEMGSSLSQGQQQRVLLARALYQKKPLLLLDEGTAHLDEETEARVLRNLKRLGVTVVMTAHKQSLAGFGTRVWEVTDGNRVLERVELESTAA